MHAKREDETASRFKFSRPPEFVDQIGYASYIGAKDGDKSPGRSFLPVAAAAGLALACLAGVLLYLWLS